MNANLEFLKDKECWVVRADRGKSIEGFKNSGIVGLDFNIIELPQEGVQVFEDKKKTYQIFEKYHPSRPSSFPNWWGTFNMFCNRMQIGDVVLSPTSTNELMVGTIESELFFELGDENLPHSLRRKVRWIEGFFVKEEFPISLQSLHCNSTCFYVDKTKGEEEEENLQNVPELVDVNTDGIVYIMKSNTFQNVFKCGYADKDAELRCSALSSDKKYAIFNLEVLGFIKSKNYRRLEKAIHNHFAPVRIWSENGCNIDSELFRSETFPIDFKEYVSLIKKQKYYDISEINLNF